MATTFKDYIPEGEDPGPSREGYKDYVPEAKPELHPVEKPVVVQPKVQPVAEVTPFKKGK